MTLTARFPRRRRFVPRVALLLGTTIAVLAAGPGPADASSAKRSTSDRICASAAKGYSRGTASAATLHNLTYLSPSAPDVAIFGLDRLVVPYGRVPVTRNSWLPDEATFARVAP